MKFSRIVFVLVSFLFAISCRNGMDEQQNKVPKTNTVPSTEYKKSKESAPRLDQKKLLEKPQNRELKKKKQRAIDTLKPVVVIP